MQFNQLYNFCVGCSSPYNWGVKHECGIYTHEPIKISDEDVERIARKVAEILSQKRSAEQ